MTLFGAIGMAGSGVTVYRKWMDAISDNISNINTATRTSEDAYRTKYVVAEAMAGGGANVKGIELGDAEGRMVYEPTHPLADEGGYVKYPDTDLGSQMGQLIMAQRGYQANLSVVDRARQAYQAALSLGRS